MQKVCISEDVWTLLSHDISRLEWDDYYPGVIGVYQSEDELLNALIDELENYLKYADNKYDKCGCGNYETEQDDTVTEKIQSQEFCWTKEDVIKHFKQEGHYSFFCTVWRWSKMKLKKH